jgi:ATP-dependent DNA helicase RecQ
MGINKPNVRYVIHHDLPKNIEGYYQETGRAGRDGEAADAWMVYGLQDMVNQRRMIDESPAADEFKQVLRGKLDALLTLAEASDCRRLRLLAYFGEASQPCGNCDNCLNPPALNDATDAARKMLSCIYRVQQASGTAFGAGHLMDILRGKVTDKVTQYGHDKLSTFGIGADLSETQWRALLRQLIAREAVRVDDAPYNTLHLTDEARPILKGETQVWLREVSESKGTGKRSARGGRKPANLAPDGQPLPLSGRECLDALKAWRAEVAREHNLPAFVIFHDATLRAIAAQKPRSMTDLDGISGIGQKKREAYGAEVLRVVSAFD